MGVGWMFRTITKRIKRYPLARRVLAGHEDARHLKKSNRQPDDFHWQIGPRGPIQRVEPSCNQIGDQLYIFGGYMSLDTVSQRVDVLDLSQQKWVRSSKLPAEIPQTHAGMANDGRRYIFSVAGQVGPNCSPGVKSCFTFDTHDHQWHPLPDLPEVRYMPLVHYYDGRLHCFGGSKPDRCSPANDHWSLAISDGTALESTWTPEPPLPEARSHTASYMIGQKLYVFGGQQTDLPPILGNAEYTCNFNTPSDVVFEEVFSFDLKTHVREDLAPMPVPLSHNEHATIKIGQQIVICGGTRDRTVLSDVVQVYDIANDRWRSIGTLPYPMKSTVAAWHDGKLFIVNGQRAVSATDLRPGEVTDSVWITNVDLTTGELDEH